MKDVGLTHIGGPTVLTDAPEEIRRRIRWLPIGVATEIASP